jgi:hypothetical protein
VIDELLRDGARAIGAPSTVPDLPPARSRVPLAVAGGVAATTALVVGAVVMTAQPDDDGPVIAGQPSSTTAASTTTSVADPRTFEMWGEEVSTEPGWIIPEEALPDGWVLRQVMPWRETGGDDQPPATPIIVRYSPDRTTVDASVYSSAEPGFADVSPIETYGKAPAEPNTTVRGQPAWWFWQWFENEFTLLWVEDGARFTVSGFAPDEEALAQEVAAGLSLDSDARLVIGAIPAGWETIDNGPTGGSAPQETSSFALYVPDDGELPPVAERRLLQFDAVLNPVQPLDQALVSSPIDAARRPVAVDVNGARGVVTPFGEIRWRPQPDLELRITGGWPTQGLTDAELVAMARAARLTTASEWIDLLEQTERLGTESVQPASIEDFLRGSGMDPVVLAGPVDLRDGRRIALANGRVICEADGRQMLFWSCNELSNVPAAYEVWPQPLGKGDTRIDVGDGVARLVVTYLGGETAEPPIEQPFPDDLPEYRRASVDHRENACLEAFDAEGESLGKVLLEAGMGSFNQEQYEDALFAACGPVAFPHYMIAAARRGVQVDPGLPTG